MDLEPTKSRANHLRSLIEAMRSAWPFLLPEVTELRANQVQALIAREDPEARGQIKAYQRLIDLPETLKGELEQLEGVLSGLPE